jgi:hypothetical protein
VRQRSDAARARGGLPRILVPQRDDARFLLGVRPLRDPFRGEFRCYAGSAWWTINRKCAEHLLRFTRERPALERYYGRTLFAVNESYPQTVLGNDPALCLHCTDDKRFVAWNDHPETGHPDVLTTRHFDAIISSGDHFARKFDERVDARVLDMLDEHAGLRR